MTTEELTASLEALTQVSIRQSKDIETLAAGVREQSVDIQALAKLAHATLDKMGQHDTAIRSLVDAQQETERRWQGWLNTIRKQ